MERLILFLTLMLISVTTHATGLDGDLIYIDGEQWVLLGKPITFLHNSQLGRLHGILEHSGRQTMPGQHLLSAIRQ